MKLAFTAIYNAIYNNRILSTHYIFLALFGVAAPSLLPLIT